MPNLLQCLRSINGVCYARRECERLRLEAYDRFNSDHERLLDGLWAALRPGVMRTGRVTEDWKTLGFQGTDPATDFRGMGMLGLTQLLFFAQNYPRRAVR